MENQQEMEIKLWGYIDGFSTSDERSVVEELIHSNEAWRRKYEELLQFSSLLKNDIDLDAPSLRFTRNVMEDISKLHIARSASSYINKNIIYGIAGFFLTIFLGAIIYGIGQVDWSAGSQVGGSTTFNFNKIDFSPLFSNNYINAFMIVNIVLALMLLDRYLAHQKKGWKKENTPR